MPHQRSLTRFVLANVVVWLLMTAVLVVVPDLVDRWVSLEIARVIGWAAAGTVWVVAIEAQWKARVGVLLRFLFQFVLWVAAALVAIWISELVTP